MKKQLNPTIKAHLIRSAFYVILLLAVCVIPFALAQRNTNKGSVAKPKAAANTKVATATATGLSQRPQRKPSALPPQTLKFPYSTIRDRGTPTNAAAITRKQLSGPPKTSSGISGIKRLGILPYPRAPRVVLYDQYDNATVTPPVDITSQDFETAFDAFDDQAADDFVVPVGETWNISEVDVMGEYVGGPAAGFNVYFYQDSGGLPGTLVYTALSQSFTGSSDFVITLSAPAVLNAGTYWVSVQSRQDFTPNGQWFWHDRDVQANSPAAWQNPGDGFATGCISWVTKTACAVLGQVAPDQVFRLVGTTGGACPPIINGDFETGDFTGWTILNADNSPVVSTNQAHGGTFSAFMGDSTNGFCGFPGIENPGDSSIYQEFTVPAGGATLGFWYWTCTTDSITFDWQDAYITDTAGNILLTIFHQCSDNEAWVEQTQDLAAFAGQTVRVEFLVHTDDFGDLTGMFVDDVTLQCGGAPTPTPTPTPSPTCTPGAGGLLVGSGLTTGFPGHVDNWPPIIAGDTVNYTFANSQAAPNEFALFETHDPWGGTIVKDAITGNGHTFTEFTPNDLAGFDFSQYRVVILNWDDTFLTDFNAQYSAAIPALEAYINAGGVVWVQAAIQGSPGDNYPMPFGGQGNGADFGASDPIVDPANPMVIGAPNPLNGNSASHVSYSGLPGAQHTVVINGANSQTVLYELFPGGTCGTPTPTPTATPVGCQFNVLIVSSDLGVNPVTLHDQIAAEPDVVTVDYFDAEFNTPTLAQLTPYNIVVSFSNSTFADPVGMGNVLADYADTGGTVVAFNFDWFGPPFGLDGRWITDGYTPFVAGGPINFNNSCLGTYDTTHPLMQGISAGSLCAFFRHTLALTAGAVSVAEYQDNEHLCAYQINNGHTGVGINAYVGDGAGQWSGPFGRVVVNAGRWLANCQGGTPTPTPTPTPISPTPTATATATTPPISPTPTATATATTPPASPTPTATATATRPPPTPRPRPTPYPRPTP